MSTPQHLAVRWLELLAQTMLFDLRNTAGQKQLRKYVISGGSSLRAKLDF